MFVCFGKQQYCKLLAMAKNFFARGLIFNDYFKYTPTSHADAVKELLAQMSANT